jgi:hypothetical protein
VVIPKSFPILNLGRAIQVAFVMTVKQRDELRYKLEPGSMMMRRSQALLFHACRSAAHMRAGAPSDFLGFGLGTRYGCEVLL